MSFRRSPFFPVRDCLLLPRPVLSHQHPSCMHVCTCSGPRVGGHQLEALTSRDTVIILRRALPPSIFPTLLTTRSMSRCTMPRAEHYGDSVHFPFSQATITVAPCFRTGPRHSALQAVTKLPASLFFTSISLPSTAHLLGSSAVANDAFLLCCFRWCACAAGLQ